MKGYSIKSQLWKNVIIKTYSFNNCISIVIHMRFTPSVSCSPKVYSKALSTLSTQQHAVLAHCSITAACASAR